MYTGNLQLAEELYHEGLAIDPTYILTLTHFANFLHRKKAGDMQRAESFYKRCVVK